MGTHNGSVVRHRQVPSASTMSTSTPASLRHSQSEGTLLADHQQQQQPADTIMGPAHTSATRSQVQQTDGQPSRRQAVGSMDDLAGTAARMQRGTSEISSASCLENDPTGVNGQW